METLAQAAGYEASPVETDIASIAQARILRGGMDPDEVGRVLLDGIQQGRFWIFTHLRWVEGPLTQRHEAMTRDGALLEI